MPSAKIPPPADATAKSEAERDRLLTAAMQVLQRSGWWGFKVESVLKQAGLSTRSFYRHFDKKTDLLLALMERELHMVELAMQRSARRSDTPPERVRGYISAMVDMAYSEALAKPTSLFSTHWRELWPEYPETCEAWMDRLIEPLEDAIEAGRASGDFTSEDPRADAVAIFYLVGSVTADQATLGGTTPREDVETILMPFVSRAIGLRYP